MRPVHKLIIHCSSTPEGHDVTIDDIRAWHTAPTQRGGNGWRDIGYHYVVHLDGSVHRGRLESTTGAHCAGHNHDSIGICYVGGLADDGFTPKDTRTPAQREAMKKLVAELLGRYPGAAVLGHNDLNPRKACPCFRVECLLSGH